MPESLAGAWAGLRAAAGFSTGEPLFESAWPSPEPFRGFLSSIDRWERGLFCASCFLHLYLASKHLLLRARSGLYLCIGVVDATVHV